MRNADVDRSVGGEAGRNRDDVFVLSAYPVAAEFLAARGLADVRSTLLSELRQGGLRGLVRSLRRIRSERGVAMIPDKESEVFAPILLSLLLFTRCRHLQIANSSGEVRVVSRWEAARSFGEILSGTVRGSLAVVRQYAVGARLRVSGRSRPKSSSAEGGWAYLRSSLWFGLKAGGSVGHVAGIVNALHRRRMRLTMMDAERPPMVAGEVPFLALPTVRRLGFPYELNNYRLDRIVTNFLRRRPISPKPGVLYQRLTLGSVSGVVLSRRWGSALVLEYNGSEAWIARKWGRGLRLYGLARLCETVSLHHAHAIVVVSEVLKEECVSRGIPSDRVIVQPNGIDPAIFDPGRFSPEFIQSTRARLDIPPGAVVLTFLGTYGMWHGAEVFAAAARRLIVEGAMGEEGRPVVYLFVGDGLRMAEVRAQFADLKLPLPIRYTGLVPQDRAAEYLAASDILVSPHVSNLDGTRFFGSPTKLFEYMAMGKAIAASDLEQIGQVLANSYRASALPEDPPPDGDDRLAVLSTPGDLDELVKSLRFLASRPEYRRVLGENARRKALARYTWDAAVEHLLQTLPKAFRS